MSHLFIGMALPPHTLSLTAAHIVGGAIASRDWQPQHHDHQWAQGMNLPGIILNTPSQLGLFCAFATAWSGPEGRIGRTALQMRQPLGPGDTIRLQGKVEAMERDSAGWTWAFLKLDIVRDGENASNCRIWLAVPGDTGCQPWKAPAELWSPPELD